MKSEPAAFHNMDKYIAGFPVAIQRILKRIRMTIRKAAPGAEETTSYQMPTFTLKGGLVAFAVFKNHIGFYLGRKGVEKFKKELSAYHQGKGSVQFPVDGPIPYDLISKIVKFRVKGNLKTAAKGKKEQ